MSVCLSVCQVWVWVLVWVCGDDGGQMTDEREGCGRVVKRDKHASCCQEVGCQKQVVKRQVLRSRCQEAGVKKRLSPRSRRHVTKTMRVIGFVKEAI